MEFIRKHKRISITVMIVLIVSLFVTMTFGRYIRNIIHDYILETKAFYFNSSILKTNGHNYSLTNWDGVNTYPITIDLKNRKSDDVVTNSDIVYSIHYDCPNTVVCTLNKSSSVIHPDDEMDTYELYVTPASQFVAGDTVTFTTYVESSIPYKKTMSATYTLGVERSNFSYEISDSVNAKFLTITFLNAITYYEALEDFGDYEEGDSISVDVYNSMTPQEQAKCFSAIVTVQYSPSVLFVDMTNQNFIDHLSTNYQEQTINGYQWVSQFSFKMNASSSTSINFYKNDITQNYKYPNGNNSPIIQVSVRLVN